MVSSLRPTFNDLDVPASIVCSFGNDLEEKSFGNVVGTGTANKETARLENLDGAEIETARPAKLRG